MGRIIVPTRGIHVRGRSPFLDRPGIPFGGGGGGGLPPPDYLFAANQYGDFFRTKDAAPASSAGLLTRWTGQRLAGNANTRFDIVPVTNAPAVAAEGPNGESILKYPAGTTLYNAVPTTDRGEAGNGGYLVTPFTGDNSLNSGLVVIAKVYVSASGSNSNTMYLFTRDNSPLMATLAMASMMGTFNLHSWYFPQRYWAGDLGVLNGQWVTVGVRVTPDGGNVRIRLYLNDGTTPMFNDSGYGAIATYYDRWFLMNGFSTRDSKIAAGLYGHIEPTDEDFANAFAWVAED